MSIGNIARREPSFLFAGFGLNRICLSSEYTITLYPPLNVDGVCKYSAKRFI